MNRKAIAIIAISTLAVILAGKLFLSAPLPVLQVAPEVLTPLFAFGSLQFNLTNTLLATWLTIIVLVLLVRSVTSNHQLIPGRLQGLVEFGIEYLYNFIAGIAGPRYARAFLPIIATIFLFVLTNAWLGLLPGFGTIGVIHHGEHRAVPFTPVGPVAVILPGAQPIEPGQHAPEGSIEGTLVPFLRGANTDLNTPLALALVSFVFVEMWGLRVNGILGYGSKFLNLRRLFRGQIGFGLLDVYVGLLELLSELVRLVSFTFRLFGNMFAGEVLVTVVVFLIPWVVVEVFFFLELLVGLIQAFVFAALTVVFATMAVAAHGGEGHEGGGHTVAVEHH